MVLLHGFVLLFPIVIDLHLERTSREAICEGLMTPWIYRRVLRPAGWELLLQRNSLTFEKFTYSLSCGTLSCLDDKINTTFISVC